MAEPVQNVVVNAPTSGAVVVSRTQKILVSPATGSVSVINAGPMGPTGATGADNSIENILTVDGQLLTRALGELAPITRPALAADPAFQSAMDAKITTHVAAADPHPVYMTSAEVDSVLSGHMAAADPHPTYLTQAEGNTSFVNVTGDTMTGGLTVPGLTSTAGINTTSLGVTVGGNNVVLAGGDGQYISFHNGSGGARRGYIQANATELLFNSEAGRARILGAGGLTVSSPIGFSGYTPQISVSDNTWIRANNQLYADTTVAAGSYVVAGGSVPVWTLSSYGGIWSNAGVQSVGINATSGQITNTYWSSTAYYGGGIYLNQAANFAQAGFHPGGVAGSIRINNNFGTFCMVDVPGTAYYGLYALNFVVNSTRKNKQDIEPWPRYASSVGAAAADTMTALGIVRDLEIVSFRRRHDQYMIEAWPTLRRSLAFDRLNKYRANRGLDPYPWKIHDCDTGTCIGTSDTPCPWYMNWEQTELGLVVEDTIGVAPEIIKYEMDGTPGGINVHSHVGLLHAAIKELEQRVHELEGAA